MKYILTSLAICLMALPSLAVTLEQQQEALLQLEVARAEINTVKALVPPFLQPTIGKNLKNAEERIIYAQRVLEITKVSEKYYCVVRSTFDGQFSGRGRTELEAQNNAMNACKLGSRSDGFFCKRQSMVCQQEH